MPSLSSHGITVAPLGATAGAALSAGRFVKITAGEPALTVGYAGAGEDILGVVAEGVASGTQATILHSGMRATIWADGTAAISAGDYLKSAANGVAVKSAADRENVGAIALEALASGTAYISVLLLAPHTERSTA